MIKKIFLASISLLLLLSALFPQKSSLTAYAEEETSEEEAEETLDEKTSSLLNELDLSAFDDFLKEMELLQPDISAKTLIDQVIHNKNEFTFEYFWKLLLRLSVGDLKEVVAQIIVILLVCILMNLMQNVSSGFAKASVKKIAYIACYGVIIAIVTALVVLSANSAYTMIRKTEQLTSAVFPILLSLMNLIGASATATIYQPLFVVFSNILLKIITYFVMPLFYACFLFHIIGNLHSDLQLNKAASFMQSLANWAIGLVFGTFVTFMTAQGITGASVDSLAAKGIQYALSGYVPVIGGYLKDGFDVMIAGCNVIKNGLGLVSIIILFLLIFPVIVKMVIASLSLHLTASLCEPYSDKKISTMLCGVSKSLHIPIVATIALAFTLLILIMLIILTCNRGII